MKKVALGVTARALLAGAAFAAFSMPAQATILTFDAQGGVTDFKTLVQSYGDNVVASPDAAGHSYGFGAEGTTANLAASYGTPGEDPSLWTTGFGDLTNIYFNDADGDTTLTLRLTADAGYEVDLYGFDLASFFTAGQTIQGLRVRDVTGNADLFSQGVTAVSGVTHNSFDFANGLSANTLEIVVDLTGLGGLSDDIGLDNVRFGQTLLPVGGVPEPATWAMMIGGFGLVGAAARRRTAHRVLA